MEIFRTESEIAIDPCEKHTGEDWKNVRKVKLPGGLILTGLTEQEHDAILNIMDGLDPLGLRGFVVTLIVNNADEDDPKNINLMFLPQKDQIIRHQDRHYLVIRVLQSTNCSAAVFVRKIKGFKGDYWSQFPELELEKV